MAMLLLDLPFDVLSPILELIQQHDASQLARTSRRAYNVVMPHILSSVVLGGYRLPELRFRFGLGPMPPARGAQQLAYFSSFLLSDVERWPLHIRSLIIHSNAFSCPPPPGRFSQRDYSGGDLLAEALRNARKLHSINVAYIETLLRQCPSFEDVFCGFDLLHTVKLSAVGPRTAVMLENLRSRPRRIQLHGVETCIQAILHSLKPHMDTVQVLALEGCSVPPQTMLYTSVFPYVHTLTLGGYAPSLSVMAATFPNVRIGRFHNVRRYGNAMKSTEWVTWPSLDTIETSSLLLLASPVRHVRLGAELILTTRTPSEAVSGLLSMLQRTQPAVLSFMICGVPPGFFEGLVAGVRCIRYLEMIQINRLKDGAGLILSQALDHISCLPLVAIGLGRVRGHETCTSDMDEEIAATVANKLPTIRLIGSSFTNSDSDEPTYDRRWFKVTSKPSYTGCRRVEEVSQQEIWAITSFVESLDREAE